MPESLRSRVFPPTYLTSQLSVSMKDLRQSRSCNRYSNCNASVFTESSCSKCCSVDFVFVALPLTLVVDADCCCCCCCCCCCVVVVELPVTSKCESDWLLENHTSYRKSKMLVFSLTLYMQIKLTNKCN